MNSSSESSRCRIELGRDRHGGLLFAAAALLAALALWLSALPWLLAALLWLLAAGLGTVEWHRRRQRPSALVLHVPDSVRFEWNERPAEDASLRRWRRIGPLLLLEADAGNCRRLDLWLPALALNDARELVRQLARMRPAGDASV